MPKYSYQYLLSSLFDQGAGSSGPGGLLTFTAVSTVNASIVISFDAAGGFSTGFSDGFPVVGGPTGINWTKDGGAITYVPFVGEDATLNIPHSSGASYTVELWMANSAADLTSVCNCITGFSSIDDKLTSLDVSDCISLVDIEAVETGGGGLLGFTFGAITKLVTLDLEGSDLTSIDVSDVVSTSFVFDMSDSDDLTSVRCIGVTTDATLDFVNCDLDDVALDQIFTDLANGTGTIDITDTTGALTCDPTIAENKGYTVVGAVVPVIGVQFTNNSTAGSKSVGLGQNGAGGYAYRIDGGAIGWIDHPTNNTVTPDFGVIPANAVLEVWPADGANETVTGTWRTLEFNATKGRWGAVSNTQVAKDDLEFLFVRTQDFTECIFIDFVATNGAIFTDNNDMVTLDLTGMGTDHPAMYISNISDNLSLTNLIMNKQRIY